MYGMDTHRILCIYLVGEGECHAHLKFDFSLTSQIHIHNLEKIVKTLVHLHPVSLHWLNLRTQSGLDTNQASIGSPDCHSIQCPTFYESRGSILSHPVHLQPHRLCLEKWVGIKHNVILERLHVLVILKWWRFTSWQPHLVRLNLILPTLPLYVLSASQNVEGK